MHVVVKDVKEFLYQLLVRAIIDSYTFPKENRIRKKNEFAQVRANGSKLYTRNLIAYVCDNQLDYPRLGLVVSKKVSKKAVIRNKIKRRLREIFRLNKNKLSSVDIVIIAKKTAAEAKYQDLVDNFVKMLKKYGNDL